MKGRRVLRKGAALLMSAALAAGCMPKAAGPDIVSAAGGKTEKTISGLGINGITAPKRDLQDGKGWDGSYVYFGKYDLLGNGSTTNVQPVKYRVLDPKTSEYGGVTMLLDCDNVLWESKFDDTTTVWKDSYIKAFLNSEGEYAETGFLTTSFDEVEQAAIATSMAQSDGDSPEGDKVFLLRKSEATRTNYGYSSSVNKHSSRIKTRPNLHANTWWMRSAGKGEGPLSPNAGVHVMGIEGDVWTQKPDMARGISPALNIDLSRVLFNSAVDGLEITPGEGYELTLLDDGLDIKVTDGQSVARTGDNITIPYTVSGVHAKDATQVSLLVTDKPYTKTSANIIEYKVLDEITTSGGEVSGSSQMDLTYAMKKKGKYFYIIAEDVNAPGESDYASEPVKIDIPGMGNTSAASEARTVSLDPSSLTPGENGWNANGNKVYFGAYEGTPTAFRVLNEAEGRLLLDCDTILGRQVFFDETEHPYEDIELDDQSIWPGSDLEKWMNGDGYYGADGVFSDKERSIIEAAPLEEGYYFYSYLDTMYSDWQEWKNWRCIDFSAEDRVFALSVGEVDSFYEDAARVKSGGEDLDTWWLRTQEISQWGNNVFYVRGDGWPSSCGSYENIGVSPAMNIGESSILLVSASGTVKTSALSLVTDGSTTKEWKLTLLDDSKAVEVAAGQQCISKDGVVTVPYTYTGTGVNQISVMITDKERTESDAQVLYYGALQVETAGGTSGSGTFDMPEELKDKTCGSDYFVYILAETVNGEKETDYASEPVKIDIVEKNVTEIDEVTVVLDEPKGGQPFDAAPECRTTGVASVTVEWLDEENTPAGQSAGYGRTYKARLKLVPEETYCFPEDTKIYLNQGADTAEDTVLTEEGTLEGTAVFTTAKAKLVSVAPPQAVTGAANGTPKDAGALGLPETVAIVTEDSSVTSADVTWNLEEFADGSYDPELADEQTFTVKGMVTLPAGIDNPDQVVLDVTIEVTVAAKGVAGAPSASPAGGTYTENQSVRLTSGTEGAKIYYTTDGSEPEVSEEIVTNGTEYTGTISVSGAEGESVTTTIRAIAVKEGLQNSPTAVFTYTINIPVLKYPVTVNYGTGTGEYAEGETVTISAGAAEEGMQFKEWNVISGQAVLENTKAATTTFTMPAETVEITAVYEESAPSYDITGGTDSGWTQGSDGSVEITGNGDFEKFTGVKVDGVLVDESNYEAKAGSTIITLKPSYLNTLSSGTHTIEILWTDGSANTTFTVNTKTPDSGNSGNENSGNGGNTGGNTGNGSGGSGNAGGGNGSSSAGGTAAGGSGSADGRATAPMTGDPSPDIGTLFMLMLASGLAMLASGKMWRKSRR